MSEVVEYIVHRTEQEELIVQLTGGGAATAFYGGMSAEDAIRNLRDLANRLERGVQKRARTQQPDLHYINKSARGEA
jgi:hypothetical protein